jgi:hypothetical protein
LKTAALFPLLAIGALAYAGPLVGPHSDGESARNVTGSALSVDADSSAAFPIEDEARTALQAVFEPGHSFYFTRAVYSGGRGFRGRGSWSTDYPKADRQFLFILRRLLTLLDAYEWENPVRLDDPELRRFPFLYALEVGYMDLTEPEVEGLRSYLEAGGFLVIDDFWGPRAWANFEYQMSRVLPGRRIVELPMDHQIFHQFYDIDEVLQVPNVGNGTRGGPYAECYNCPPRVLAILDDDDGVVEETDRIMVVINCNTDLGDAWEWSENPYYPFAESTYAYELAVNFIIYAMTH